MEKQSRSCHIFYSDRFFAIMLLMCVLWGMGGSCQDGGTLWISTTRGSIPNCPVPIRETAPGVVK